MPFSSPSLARIFLKNYLQYLQIQPSNGFMRFEEYDKEKTFRVVIVKDDLPELDMNITIQLQVINGEL